MKTGVITAAVVAGFVAIAFSFPAQAQSGCLKEVFHKYCLGGSAKALLSRHTPIQSSEKDGTTRYVFADGQEQTTVAVVHGRIASVARRYAGGSLQVFDQIGRDLRAIYGEPRRTSGNQVGRMTDLWDRKEWRIVMTWQENSHVLLVYSHEALQAATKSTKPYNPGSAGSNPRGY